MILGLSKLRKSKSGIQMMNQKVIDGNPRRGKNILDINESSRNKDNIHGFLVTHCEMIRLNLF